MKIAGRYFSPVQKYARDSPALFHRAYKKIWDRGGIGVVKRNFLLRRLFPTSIILVERRTCNFLVRSTEISILHTRYRSLSSSILANSFCVVLLRTTERIKRNERNSIRSGLLTERTGKFCKTVFQSWNQRRLGKHLIVASCSCTKNKHFAERELFSVTRLNYPVKLPIYLRLYTRFTESSLIWRNAKARKRLLYFIRYIYELTWMVLVLRRRRRRLRSRLSTFLLSVSIVATLKSPFPCRGSSSTKADS